MRKRARRVGAHLGRCRDRRDRRQLRSRRAGGPGGNRDRRDGLPSRQRHPARDRDHLRQRPLQPRQPERPLRPRADAGARELHHRQRHAALQQPHAADRAHRRRHASPPTPASTATARARASPTTTRSTTPDGTVTVGVVVRLLDRHLRRSTPYPNMPYSATVPAAARPPRRRPRRGCRSPAPAATSATSRPRTWSSRTSIRTSRTSSAPNSPEVAQLQRRDHATPYKDQETNDYLGLAVHCAQGDAVLRRRRGGQVRQTRAVADGGRRRAPRRARRLQRLPGAVREQVPRSRSSAAAANAGGVRTSTATATRSSTPPATSST